MFLTALQKQNSALINASLELWQQGKLLPDTYVIDIDQLLDNARQLVDCAKQYGIKMYAMPKQIGHNPWVCNALIALGFDGIVAVDFKEALQLYRHNIPVAHVGHLVQPPLHLLDKIIERRPEVITVYSVEKAREIAEAASRHHYVQPLLLKVYQQGDLLYPGQEAGFTLSSLPEIINTISQLSGVRIVGVTHFPCMLYNAESQQTAATKNLSTLIKAKNVLQQHGVTIEQVNAPSASSCETIPQLAAFGVTHAEPGHALTGTTPANQQGTQVEKIAMLYLSEISHHFDNNSYFFGGGYYRRGNLKNALIIDNGQWQQAEVLPTDESSIDYYLCLKKRYPISHPVICCFRTQIFVTRSDVALVKGIQSGHPELIAVYDSQGRAYE